LPCPSRTIAPPKVAPNWCWVKSGVKPVEVPLARIRGLSPLATLQRGYSLLQGTSGDIVTDPSRVSTGDTLVARVAGGRLDVTVDATHPDQQPDRTQRPR